MNDLYPWNEKHLDDGNSSSDIAKGIRYMREMGYSYDEIEDMLVNPECYGAEFALAEL